MGEDEDSLVFLLRMQALVLLDKRHRTAEGKDDGRCDQTDKESCRDITDDETENRTAGCACGPIDVAALETQEFKRPLKPLEHWVVLITVTELFHDKQA